MKSKLAAALFCALIAFAACKGTTPETTTSTTIGASKVSGRITASDTAQPLADVSVTFFTESGSPVGPSATTSTDGRYGLEIPPGRYRVLVNAATESRPLGWNGYSPTWTNGDLTDGRGERLSVEAGQATDYNLALKPLRPVSGTVKASGGPGLNGQGHVTVVPFAGSGTFASVPLPSGGKYTIPVPDGDWQIQADVPGYQQGVSQKFTVNASPTSAPDVTLSPA